MLLAQRESHTSPYVIVTFFPFLTGEKPVSPGSNSSAVVVSVTGQQTWGLFDPQVTPEWLQETNSEGDTHEALGTLSGKASELHLGSQGRGP